METASCGEKERKEKRGSEAKEEMVRLVRRRLSQRSLSHESSNFLPVQDGREVQNNLWEGGSLIRFVDPADQRGERIEETFG